MTVLGVIPLMPNPLRIGLAVIIMTALSSGKILTMILMLAPSHVLSDLLAGGAGGRSCRRPSRDRLRPPGRS